MRHSTSSEREGKLRVQKTRWYQYCHGFLRCSPAEVREIEAEEKAGGKTVEDLVRDIAEGTAAQRKALEEAAAERARKVNREQSESQQEEAARLDREEEERQAGIQAMLAAQREAKQQRYWDEEDRRAAVGPHDVEDLGLKAEGEGSIADPVAELDAAIEEYLALGGDPGLLPEGGTVEEVDRLTAALKAGQTPGECASEEKKQEGREIITLPALVVSQPVNEEETVVHSSDWVTLVKVGGEEYRLPWAERYRLLKLVGQKVRVNSPVTNEWGWLDDFIDHLCPRGEVVYSGGAAGFNPFFSDVVPGLTVRTFEPPVFGKGDDPRPWKAAVDEIVRASNGAIVHSGRVYVATSKLEGWLKPWPMEVEDGPKTAKRMVTMFTRLFRFQGRFAPDQVKIGWIEGEEKPHDGLGYITEHRAKLLIIKGITRAQHKLKGVEQKIEEAVDQKVRRQHQLLEVRQRLLKEYRKVLAAAKKARQHRLFNGRILIPKGTPGCERGGQWKGNLAVVKSLPGGVDILTHKCNVKTETHGFEEWSLGIDPRPPIRHVRCNLQVLLFLPGLVTVEEIKDSISASVVDAYLSAKDGGLVERFEDLLEEQERAHNEGDDWLAEAEDLSTAIMRDRWALYSVWDSGIDYRTSPNLVEKGFRGRVRTLADRLGGRIRVKIPCATEEQVIGLSAAKVFEPTLEVPEGSLRRLPKWGLSVVGDETWLRMIDNHGGADLDDHFCLLARVVQGKKVWVVFRNPVGPGEYTVLDYLEGDEAPTTSYKTLQGEAKVSWPEADLSQLGEPVGDLIRGGKVRVLRLPEGEKGGGGSYTPESVSRNLDRLLAGTNPGKFINAVLLLGMVAPGRVMEELIDIFGGLYQLEKVVDACVQGGSVEALQVVNEAADLVVQAACKLSWQEGYSCVDRLFLQTRNMRFEEGEGPRVGDTWFTEVFDHLDSKIQDAWDPREGPAKGKRLRSWAQQQHRMPEVLRTNACLPNDDDEDRELVGILRATRKAFADHNTELQERRKQGFVSFQDELVEKDRLVEACFAKVGPARVGKFAHVVHRERTFKTKEVSDALLFTKSFLRYYLLILQAGKENPLPELSQDGEAGLEF